MPRRCSICDHDERERIDHDLLSGEPYRSIAKQYGTSESAMYRHKADHIPSTLAKAQEAGEVARAGDLLARLGELTEKARRIGGKAEDEGDYRAALAAVRELVRIVELQGKLAGELNEAPTVNNYFIGETVQAVILEALGSFPEARRAVAVKLAELEASPWAG